MSAMFAMRELKFLQFIVKELWELIELSSHNNFVY